VVTAPCFLGNPATNQLYPYGTLPSRTAVVFNESGTLEKLEPTFAVSTNDTIRLWYGDEHALLLGIRSVSVKTKAGTTTTSYPVSAFVANPLANSVTNPLVGATEAQGGVDFSGRPIPPSLFCTDISPVALGGSGPLSNAGDWQQGGTALKPNFVSGTWKGATVLVDQTKTPSVTTITTDADPAKNHYTLGPGADPVPAGLIDLGYGAEARWSLSTLTCNGVPLQSGHSYRMQLMIHDGDQNKGGGDVGQACMTVTLP
jgi:hypothetical protein